MREQKLKEDRAMSLREVAAELGITKERVRQIERKALAKLNARLQARGLSAELILPPGYDEAKA